MSVRLTPGAQYGVRALRLGGREDRLRLAPGAVPCRAAALRAERKAALLATVESLPLDTLAAAPSRARALEAEAGDSVAEGGREDSSADPVSRAKAEEAAALAEEAAAAALPGAEEASRVTAPACALTRLDRALRPRDSTVAELPPWAEPASTAAAAEAALAAAVRLSS